MYKWSGPPKTGPPNAPPRGSLIPRARVLPTMRIKPVNLSCRLCALTRSGPDCRLHASQPWRIPTTTRKTTTRSPNQVRPLISCRQLVSYFKNHVVRFVHTFLNKNFQASPNPDPHSGGFTPSTPKSGGVGAARLSEPDRTENFLQTCSRIPLDCHRTR